MKKHMLKNGKLKTFVVILMFLIPFITVLMCLSFGRMNLSFEKIFNVFYGLIMKFDVPNVDYSVVVNLRLPRIITALIVGAGLSCAGASFQSLFANPLATPDILGVTSGTCVGAIIAIIMSRSIVEVQIIGLAFGLLSVFITLNIAGDKIRESNVVLVLSGVIISALFGALGSFLKYTADPLDKLPEITYWLMGSFTGSTYNNIILGTPLIIIGISIIFLFRWRLNILSLSKEEAKSCGIDLPKTRLMFILASTFITASTVAMSGQVGWIALLIPHCARMMVGSDNRVVIPISISLGATFMVLIDTLSRTIGKIELPVSILTAIIGAPLFISLLRRTRGALK